MESPVGPVSCWYLYGWTGNFDCSNIKKYDFELKRFVDDTVGYVKNGSIDTILSRLNSFHLIIQLTYEVEQETTIFGRPANQK